MDKIEQEERIIESAMYIATSKCHNKFQNWEGAIDILEEYSKYPQILKIDNAEIVAELCGYMATIGRKYAVVRKQYFKFLNIQESTERRYERVNEADKILKEFKKLKKQEEKFKAIKKLEKKVQLAEKKAEKYQNSNARLIKTNKNNNSSIGAQRKRIKVLEERIADLKDENKILEKEITHAKKMLYRQNNGK